MDHPAVLYPINPQEGRDIPINQREFSIGRAKNASYDIVDLGISRNHCVLRHNDIIHSNTWSICDKSTSGTWVNGKRLRLNTEVCLNDGDRLQLGELRKYSYIFCSNFQNCPNSCQTRISNSQHGLDAEMAQRRRFFDYQASLQKDGLEKSILEKQQTRQQLQHQQKLLHDTFQEQLQVLVTRNIELQKDLEKKGNASGSSLAEEKEQLQKKLSLEKQNLEEVHLKETQELSKKISAFEAAESELKSQNKELLDRLAREKQQFEIRLEEERKSLEAKFAEQLAEQQRLAAEKSEVEEALRLRIQDLEKVANREEKEQQQRLVEQEKEEARLSKEKNEFEKRLQELQSALEEKERQEKEKEKAFLERDLLLKAQEEERERERKEREEKMEAEFQAKKLELENLERLRQQELSKHKEEVTKELKDREAELKRKAEEHQRELEAQKLSEQERLKKEMLNIEMKLRSELEAEVSKLQEEKALIERQIRGQLSKKEGENAEVLVKLRSELEQVKKDLDSTSDRRTHLEKELEEASRAKEAASRNEQQAKQDVIENFGEVVESELQCSICNELFVAATTLNCNHTFCQECISSWVKKSKTCPICRAACTQQRRTLVLDSFIDRIVENLSDDMKKRRKEIVEERRVLAHVENLEANPHKKRKTTHAPAAANTVLTVPLQLANGILHHNVPRMLNAVPVTMAAVPPGATVVRLPLASRNLNLSAAPAPPAAPGPPPSTSRPTPPPAAGPTYLQRGPPPSQPQRPPSAPPSSSAPNRTTQIRQMRMRMAQPHAGVPSSVRVRTRGGAAARPVGQPVGQPVWQPPVPMPYPYGAVQPPYPHHAAAQAATQAVPRATPPLILRTQSAPIERPITVQQGRPRPAAPAYAAYSHRHARP